ncbi:MAG: hypothetical protein OEM52_15200 [bacterium]|nr:hypothetical protein [bacterium]
MNRNPHFLVVCFLVVILFTSITPGYCSQPSEPPWIGAVVSPRLKLGKPFTYSVHIQSCDSAEVTSLDILLPTGVMLQKGKLRWEGKIGRNEQVDREIVLRIDSAGTYAIRTVYNMANFLETRNAELFPCVALVNIYATADTMLSFYSQEDLDNKLKPKQQENSIHRSARP